MSSRKSDQSGHALGSALKSAWLLPALFGLWWIGTRVENPGVFDPYYARIVMLIGINITLAVSLQLINGISGQFSLGHAGFMAVGAYIGSYATTTFGGIITPKDDLIDFANPCAMAWYFICLGIVVGLGIVVVYGMFALIRESSRLHASLPGILMLLVLAWVIFDVSASAGNPVAPAYFVWSRIFGLLPRTFDTLMSAGLPAASHCSAWLPQVMLKPICFLTALFGGGVFAAIAGLLVGLPTLRLRGDYLAIATLGAGEIIRVVITNSEPLGRATGLSIPVYANSAGAGEAAHYIFPWVYGVALITTLLIWRLKHSAKGRAIAAVREDEIAAAAMGIDITHHKVIAFIIGAFFAGVAGALYGHYDGYLNPNTFNIMRSIELVVMVTLGGLGSIWGAIVAAIVLTLLPEVLRNQPVFIKESRMVIYSLLLVLIMICRAKRPWRWVLRGRRADLA